MRAASSVSRNASVRVFHVRFLSPAEGDVHLEGWKGFWERIRHGQGAEKIAFDTQWQPFDRLIATVGGWLVVDPARTWSSSNFSSESEAVPGNKSLTGVRDEFSLFNVGAVHGSDIFDVDTLPDVSIYSRQTKGFLVPL